MRAITKIIISLLFCVSFAKAQTFFGEDLAPLASGNSTPNSDIARDDFIAALSGVGTEDFEGFNGGESVPLNITFGTAGTATLNNNGYVETASAFGAFANSGSKYLFVRDNFKIDFATPQAAIGFYTTDVSDYGSVLTLKFEDVNGNTTDIVVPHSVRVRNGSSFYYGYISPTDFVSVKFEFSQGEIYGFDDFSFGPRSQTNNTPSTSTSKVPGLDLTNLFLLAFVLTYLVFKRNKFC